MEQKELIKTEEFARQWIESGKTMCVSLWLAMERGSL